MEFWSVSPREVAQLTGAGGERFVEFCTSLIREMVRAAQIPASAVADMLKANVPDGGVDTDVGQGSLTESTGYLRAPTCWQFKATTATELTARKLQDELRPLDARSRPRYVAERLRNGAAYRFCVADEITAERKAEIEGTLRSAVSAIDADAPDSMVLGASDLAALAGHFPALVVRFFRAAPTLLHLDAWGRNATAEAPVYVAIERWNGIGRAIRNHVDFSRPVETPIFAVAGDPGLGKTRLVYEGLRAAGGLVLYTADEACVEIAHVLANDARMHAILVVDDCTVTTKVRLASILRGHVKRVRTIVIEPYGDSSAVSEANATLAKMPAEAIDAVLAANCPEVPLPRRDAYRTLAGGYVRFALALCSDDAHLRANGVHRGLTVAHDYLRTHLMRPDERDVVHALSLVTRLGFRGALRDELALLSTFLGFDTNVMKDAAMRLHDRGAFVAREGPYLFVDPEIVANTAFQSAWGRWGGPDPAGFMAGLPEQLLPAFRERVRRSADLRVRATSLHGIAKRASARTAKPATNSTPAEARSSG